MERQGKKAIVLGATGLVGRLLTRKLLKNAQYSEVLIMGRTPFGERDPKLTEIRADLRAPEDFEHLFSGDVVFCCIGTTKAKTPDKKKYKAIDYGIPVTAARLCKANGIPAFLVISALGANPQSSLFYNRIKGEMEAAVLRYDLPHTYLLQPSLIGGNRSETRKGEKLAIKIMGLLQPIFRGPLAKYRIIEPDTIAEAMIYLAEKPQATPRIPSDQIQKLGQEAKS